MNVDTGAFQALTAQLADLTEQVRVLAQTRITLEAAFDAGMICGEERAERHLLGRTAETARPPMPRPSRLRVVRDERRRSS